MRYFDTSLLSTFITVSKLGTISAASSQLNLSNSTISEQLSKLEAFVGKKLMIRNRQGTSLTAEGHLLLIEAEKILTSCAITLEKLRGVQFSGELRIAITDYFRPHELTQILKRIQKEFPNLKINIYILSSEEIKDSLFLNHYDISIYMEINTDVKANSHTHLLREEPLFWIKAPEFNINSNGLLPIVTISSCCNLKDFTNQILTKNKNSFYITHTASGVKGITSAVEAGLGISCINKSSLNENIEIIREHNLLPPLPNIQFILFVAPHANNTVHNISKFLVNYFL